jgi:hypothetical protein
MKFCKDCRWCVKDGGLLVCGHEKNLNPVDGRPVKTCQDFREDGWFFMQVNETCGRKGQFWGARPVTWDVSDHAERQLLD